MKVSYGTHFQFDCQFLFRVVLSQKLLSIVICHNEMWNFFFIYTWEILIIICGITALCANVIQIQWRLFQPWPKKLQNSNNKAHIPEHWHVQTVYSCCVVFRTKLISLCQQYYEMNYYLVPCCFFLPSNFSYNQQSKVYHFHKTYNNCVHVCALFSLFFANFYSKHEYPKLKKHIRLLLLWNKWHAHRFTEQADASSQMCHTYISESQKCCLCHLNPIFDSV